MLTERYDNKRVLLSKYMHTLLICPKATKKSVGKLLRVTDATNESIGGFQIFDGPRINGMTGSSSCSILNWTREIKRIGKLL